MVSTLAVIAAAGVLMWTAIARPTPTLKAAAGEAATITDVTEVIAASHLTNIIGTGPIALVEFTDFQCPFCAKHATETMPTLKRELFDTGKARYAVVNLPLAMHAEARNAAEAAECAAAQGQYWPMHDLLFAEQKLIPAASGERFSGQAKALGLDVAAFNTCLTNDTTLPKILADQAEAKRLDVTGTPAIFLGRVRPDGGVDLVKRVHGALPADVILGEVARLTKG